MEGFALEGKARQMFVLIEKWQQSGSSRQQFCKALGIAYSKFHYWYKRYRKQQSGTFVGAEFKKIEIAGQIDTHATDGAWVVVRYADGRHFRFYQPIFSCTYSINTQKLIHQSTK